MTRRGSFTQDQNVQLLSARVAFAAAQRDFEDDDGDEEVTESDHDLIFSEFVEALVRFAFAKHKSLVSMNNRDKVKLIVDGIVQLRFGDGASATFAIASKFRSAAAVKRTAGRFMKNTSVSRGTPFGVPRKPGLALSGCSVLATKY
jgi:hypothetical protein